MKKNMYSLMLSEDIVSQIDRLAASEKTSRSGLINSILADYVSYRTPEKRIREMFERMEQVFSGTDDLQVMLRGSDSFFNLRSALAYKYNPAVNYSIELYKIVTDTVGEIRVSLRTQSSALKHYLVQFYRLWADTEEAYAVSDHVIDGEKFVKRLSVPKGYDIDENVLCNEIYGYITAFDTALKTFFANLDDAGYAAELINELYAEYCYSRRITL